MSFLDVIYLIHSQHSPSFISKIDVKKLPLVGVICTGSQGVYVSRENQDNRSEALDAISKRVDLAQKGVSLPPLAIAPEGTTTSGRQLISFKKGAFLKLAPIQVVCLDYQPGSFRVSADQMSLGVTMLLMMCQWSNRLDVTSFDSFDPQGLPSLKAELEKHQDSPDQWSIYARTVKSLMAQTLRVPQTESRYQDKKAYLERLRKSNN